MDSNSEAEKIELKREITHCLTAANQDPSMLNQARKLHDKLQMRLEDPCDTGMTVLKVFEHRKWLELSSDYPIELLSNCFTLRIPTDSNYPYKFQLRLQLREDKAKLAVLADSRPPDDLLTWPIVPQVSATFFGGRDFVYGTAQFLNSAFNPWEAPAGNEIRRCCELELPKDWLTGAIVNDAVYLKVQIEQLD